MEEIRKILDHVSSFTYGGMTEMELIYLYNYCNDKNVLELGSMVGMSSYVIASTAKRLTCVDIWSNNQNHLEHDPKQALVYKQYEHLDFFSMFKENCKEFIDNGKITICRGNTIDLADSFKNESFDIILIDSDHSYWGVSTDFGLYYDKIKKDGLMLFHDYNDEIWTGIKQLCDEKVLEGKIQFVEKKERLGIFKK